MITIGSRTGHKLGILLILTTLTIGSAAGITIDYPDSSTGTLTGSFDLNVSGDGSADYNIWRNYDGEWMSEGSASDDTSIGNTNWDPGTHTIKVNTSNYQDSVDVEVDNEVPTKDSDAFTPEDGSYISETSPEIEVKVNKNGPADLSSVWLEVSGNDNTYTEECTDFDDSNPRTCSFSPDLEEGNSYDVSWNATDTVDNTNDGSWSFNVDTEYDGDDNPSFSVEDASNGVVLFNEDKDLTVDFGDADSASATDVTCYVGGEDVDEFTVDTGDGDEEYTCEIPEDDNEDYYDNEADVWLEMEDQAGNTAESDRETISFDANSPQITGLDIPSSADLYNSNFDVEFTAFDSASDIEEVKYYFSDDTAYNDGTDIDYSADQDSYEIDTSNLETGDHTLYVRAKDEADRWSSTSSVDFSFDPGAVPEASLSVPESLSVTAGNEGSFDITVENTGELHISSMELTASAEGVFSQSQTISDLEPGDSITSTLNIDTQASNLGKHAIEVSIDNPSKTKEIGLIVEANSEQQDQVDSDLSEYQSKLQKVESNVTELKQKVSQERKQRLESNFSKFRQKVEDAQNAVESGDYYKAESTLENIDQDYSAAESSYNTVKKEYENNRFWMLLLGGVGGVIVLGVGVIGGLTYTDEVDFDVRDYLEKLKEIEVDTSALEGLTDNFERKMEGKDTSDADEFKWDGFNDE